MHHACTLSTPTLSRWSPSTPLATLTKLIGFSLVVIARLWWLREERKAMKTLCGKETALLLYGLILDSGETTCYKHRYCVKHAEQLLQLLEETQPTSITTCSTTIKTYTNNSKLTLAIINCIVNNMQSSIFVYLSQVISSSQYWTELSHFADFPHIVQA